MAFEKGNKMGKGRPKGSKNKSNKIVKRAFEQLLTEDVKSLRADLNTLKPYERLKIKLELAQYILPKLKATEMDIKSNGESLDLPMITFIKRGEKD